jgi:hypothetical protein
VKSGKWMMMILNTTFRRQVLSLSSG